MRVYKKESLELLRQRIDLSEVISAHVQMHRAGAAYKALCPFHEEKTPSFVVQKGDTHYHCFGCGAHGDAIAFLMGYLKLSFSDAIEDLAARFQVVLETEEEEGHVKGPNKNLLKNALERACRFYHFSLLYSEEGEAPLKYLYERGLDLDFIQAFQVGYAPADQEIFQRMMREQGIEEQSLEQSGLLNARRRPFFSDRITFPIRDATGAVIGFSARKFKEETFGGKYINTPETALFKKSHVLFGLSYCRHRIAKERKAIVVEGQIDALRLIHAGFNFTVAGQGTAFGEGHVRELLNLGANHIYLALDGDNAGQEATAKIGNLFQKKGVEVSVVALPGSADPDSLLRSKGPDVFAKLLEESTDYLSFLFKHMSKSLDPNSPSMKNECVEMISSRIREWDHPVMVHESLRKLAALAELPEAMIELGKAPLPQLVKKPKITAVHDINPDRILECDLLRWMLLLGEAQPKLLQIVRANLLPEHFRIDACRRLFALYLEACDHNRPCDLLSLGMELTQAEEHQLLSDIMQKRINLQRAEAGLIETIQKLLQRHWMELREAIKMKIQSGKSSDEEAMELAKQFDAIKKKPPAVALP